MVILSFPNASIAQTSPLPKGVERLVLQDLSEECLEQQLAFIHNTYGSIGAFIHLHPVFAIAPAAGIHFLEADRAIVKQVFFLAKHLKQSLIQAASRGYSCFLTVTRLDGMLGLGREKNFSPISGGLFGLTKTVNQEWRSVFCRAIDLSPNLSPQESVKSIVAELHDPNLWVVEVGHSSQGRATLVLNH